MGDSQALDKFLVIGEFCRRGGALRLIKAPGETG